MAHIEQHEDGDGTDLPLVIAGSPVSPAPDTGGHRPRRGHRADASAMPPMPWLDSYPKSISWNERIETAPVHNLLEQAARDFPTRPCIEFQGRIFSYGEIWSLSRRLAAGLRAQGFLPGMKLGLFLPNCPTFVALYYACLQAGGIVVNFNPLYSDPEILHQIEDSGTDYMVTLDLKILLPKISAMLGRTGLKAVVVVPLASQLPTLKALAFRVSRRGEIADVPADGRHWLVRDLLRKGASVVGEAPAADSAVDPEGTVAVLQYTGGTTGMPKAATLTHANVYANAMQCKAWFKDVGGPESRVVGVLPLFHAFAMTCIMNWTISVGGCMLLEPRFDARTLLRLINRRAPTALAGVPTLFTALLNTPQFADTDFGSLKFCVSGGAPLPNSVRESFEARSGVRIFEGYGLSETSPVCCVSPLDRRARPGSVGLPLPGTTCEVVSLDDRRTILPPGQTGEICFRGPQVMKGYWNNPAATADVIRNGRLHTGDVGHMDPDGFVYITDRLKEMIIASGFKVYPRNVEEAIYAHPAVKECAVYGIDDAYRGQTVKAVICPLEGMTLDAREIDRFLESRLSPIEMPKVYEFREALPKTAVGKIHKKALIDADRSPATAIEQERP